MIEAAGWLGAILLASCGAPQAWRCYRQGHSEGIDPAFLWMWLGGEVAMVTYIVATAPQLPLLANYAVNTLVVAVVLRYMYFPRKAKRG